MKKVYLGYQRTQLVNEPNEEGQSIEEMIRKATATNEPIEANAPMVYTEKAKGVLPETDIRTDRFELAIDAIDKFSKSETAKEKGVESAETETPEDGEKE